MAKLRKFTLQKNEQTNRWELTSDRPHRTLRSFKTKASATTAGVLKRALGRSGGSITIHSQNGQFQEERTFPASKDPRRSRG